ncbi:MAG TPA: alpha-ketoglutarate-dependent dioxygenase AlkB [Flavisolibacter sp.]
MNSLFPDEPRYPTGFQYHENFISVAEEAELLAAIKAIELHTFIFQGYEAKRRVASFGYDWSFTHRRLSKGKAIPSSFYPLMEKVATRLALHKDDFAELLVLEYPPGAVINWHRDAPPFNLIAGITLLSDCIFRLKPYDKTKQKGALVSVPVHRRSLYVMDGPSRSEWQHSTAPVKQTRYSVTLRTLK